MGMYTEILVRAELSKDTPDEVLAALRCMIGDADEPASLPNHELFICDRWDMLGRGRSAYFPVAGQSYIAEASDWPGLWLLFMHANLKNYDGEISKFFDWIDPYIAEVEGAFIGFSLYEEADTPTLYFKR